MLLILSRRTLSLLLALLLLASSLLTASLTMEQGMDHSQQAGVHSHAGEHHHSTRHHDGASADLHHVAAIDGGTDEHGHHFHVHLPAHALVAAFTFFDYEFAPPVMAAFTPLLLPSLTYAPPVPPPNV